MRQFIIAAAVAFGLIALWAAILPLTAQPAPPPGVGGPHAMSKALFLCKMRGQNGLDQACVGALAKAMVLDAQGDAPELVSERRCQADNQALASLSQRE